MNEYSTTNIISWNIDIASYNRPMRRDVAQILFSFPCNMQDYEIFNMADLNGYNVYRITAYSEEIPNTNLILRAFESLPSVLVIAIDGQILN